jgi:hypothetical protein
VTGRCYRRRSPGYVPRSLVAAGWPIAAVGLAGKVLGPSGLGWLIVTGTWPAGTVVIIITNDLIWWLPFAIYLRDAWPDYRHCA